MSTEAGLPPGYFRNDVQWVCQCPFCNREEHFEINIERMVGHCFICERFCRNEFELKKAFAGRTFEIEDRPARKVHIKCIDPLERCSAWDHERSRLWCQGKNFSEVAIRETRIQYSPEQDEMYLRVHSISKDLPESILYRPLHGQKQKWLHLGGTKAAYYGWNVNSFKDRKRNCLVCEGMSDLLATRLYPEGIAVLGSSLLPVWFYWMKKNINKVFFWFDADAAGEKAYAAAEMQAVRYELDFESIRTKKDPKHFAPQFPADQKFLNDIRSKLANS